MTALPARPSTKREQREASIERLLGAALSRFVGQGFSHTTVEQIADDAGLTKGSVYFYFKGKDALLMAVLDRVEQVVVDDMIARVSAAGPGAADKIVAFVHGQARLGVDRWEHVLLLILMSLEFAGRGGPVEDRTKAIYARMYRTIEDVLELGRRQGVFRDDLRTREQAAIVLAGHDGTFLEWYRRGADFDGEELVRALRTATLGGLVETRNDPAGATAPATERRIG